MRGEDQRRLAVVAQLDEALDASAVVELDAARPFGMLGVVVPQPVEMRELGADAAEIVPDAAQDALDLGRRFLRERRRQVGAADAVLAEQRPDRAHEASRRRSPACRTARDASCAAGRRRARRRRMPARLSYRRQRLAVRADQRHGRRAARSGRCVPLRMGEPGAQKLTMTLPNTCRLSSRARPRSNSASAHFGVDDRRHAAPPSWPGCRGCCASRQPNEPKILYCCWNSCIRLIVTVGPGGRAAGDEPAAALEARAASR